MPPTFDEVVSVGSNESVVRIAVVGKGVGITLIHIILLSTFTTGHRSLGCFLVASVLLLVYRLGQRHLDARALNFCTIQVIHSHHSIVPASKVHESIVADLLYSFDAARVELAEDLAKGLLAGLNHQIAHIEDLHCFHDVLINVNFWFCPVDGNLVTPELCSRKS